MRFLILFIMAMTFAEEPVTVPVTEVTGNAMDSWYTTLNKSFAISKDIAEIKENLTEKDQGSINAYNQAMAERAVSAELAAKNGMETPQIGVGTSEFPRRNTLYLFWSFEAPGAVNLTGALSRLKESRPDIPVAQLHCLRLPRWEKMMLTMKRLDQQLKALIAEDRHEDAKRLSEAVIRQYGPLRDMSAYFGTKGMQPFADVRGALLLGVETMPAWRYVSRRGLVHGISGCGPMLNLAQWIDGIERWETAAEESAAKEGKTLLQWADGIAIE
jgi:hypothetical protein